jgi:drug/metabolite transporter (DMT)-like permease
VPRRNGSKAPFAAFGLVVAAFFWGTTFVVVQDAIDRVDPMPFLALRFTLAAVVLGLIVRFRPVPSEREPALRRRVGSTPLELRHGIAAGLALLAAYVLQTLGLLYTTPSASAFITYLLVVLVPVFAFVFLRRRPQRATVVGIVLAVIGLLVLTGAGSGGLSFGTGEALALGCAAGFAAHLLIVGEVTGQHDPIRFTCVQIATVALVCVSWTVVASAARGDGTFGGIADGPALLAAAFTGVFATAVAFVGQVWAQRRVGPPRAALILLLEPIFAALLDWSTGGALPTSTLIGGALILFAVAVAELPVLRSSLR